MQVINSAHSNIPSNDNHPFWETLQYLEKDPVRSNCFLLIKPHLLYLTNNQADSYLNATSDLAYSKNVHHPGIQVIEAHLEAITRSIIDSLSLIELGPGYPDMSLSIIKYCQSKNIAVHYYPVDVNAKYLQIASEVTLPYAASVKSIQAKFEDCQPLIPLEAYSRQVYLMIGLTFMNFEPEIFIPLLKKIAGPKASIILSSELITADNSIDKIIKNYQGTSIQKFTFNPLANLGVLPTEVEYVVDFYKSRIECGFIFKSDYKFKQVDYKVIENSELIIRAGDKVITAISYRYTFNDIFELLGKFFQQSQYYLSPSKNLVVALNLTY